MDALVMDFDIVLEKIIETKLYIPSFINTVFMPLLNQCFQMLNHVLYFHDI